MTRNVSFSQGNTRDSETINTSNNTSSSTNPNKKFYVATHLTPNAPFSLYLGGLREKFGFLIGFRSSLILEEPQKYFDENGTIETNTNPFSSTYGYSYEYISGSEKIKAFSLTIGATHKLSDKVWTYGAIGLGLRRSFREYTEYDRFGNYNNITFAEYEGFHAVGVEAEGGLIFKLNALTLNLGYTCVNVSNFNFSFGLGLAL